MFSASFPFLPQGEKEPFSALGQKRTSVVQVRESTGSNLNLRRTGSGSGSGS